MSSWVATALITAGLTATIVGTIGANIVFLPFLLRHERPPPAPEARAIAVFEALFRLLQFSTVMAVGLTFLVLGEVIGYGLPRWAPALPLALTIGTIGTAWSARWRLRRARR
jgi:hypothetical protein